MSYQFHVGMQVVCVDARIGRVIPRHDLTKGRIYTIRGIDPDRSGELGLYLEEVRLPNYPQSGEEISFAFWRFRPVKRTDISIFQQMLAPKPRVTENV